MDPLDRACEIAGSQSSLASALGVVPMTVSQWKRRGIPADWAPKIEAAVGGAVTRYDLRPDVFGEDPGKAKRKGRAA